MKITNNTLSQAQLGLLYNCKTWSNKDSLKVYKLKLALQDHVDFFIRRREELLHLYGVGDPKEIQSTSEHWSKVVELMNMEIEFDFDPIPIENLPEDLKLSANEIGSLIGFLRI